MNTLFNFKLVDGTTVSQSFEIVPINFPTVSSSFLVNGDILTSSVSPNTIDLLPNVYKIELNRGAANNWYVSGSNSTASVGIISGSYSTASLCSVSWTNINNGRNYDAGKQISIKPVVKNVGSGNSFILEDTIYYNTDATGSLVVSLVPQVYSVQYHGSRRTEPYSILVPASASVNVKDILVTTNHVSRNITPKNSAEYSYTAQVIDADFVRKNGAIDSASFATFAVNAANSVSASHALVADSVLGSIASASFSNRSISASYSINADNAITAAFATNSTNAVNATNAQTAAFANGLTFVPSLATSSSFASTASFVKNAQTASLAVSASWAPIQVSSSFATTASFASRVISSSYATTATTATQLENRGTFPASISTSGNNGFNIADADGSVMGITGGGISIIYNPISAVPPFIVRNVNNVTLSKIDGNGNFVCVNSASFSGSLFGTASYSQTASVASTASYVGYAPTASYVSSSGTVTIQSGNNTTEFRNTSSGQTVNFYGSASSATSFNRLAIYHNASNGMTIESQPQGSASSSGDFIISHAANHSIKFQTSGGVQRWSIASGGDLLPSSAATNIGQAGVGVNNLWVTNINGSSITGSLFGTASFAQTASFVTASNVKGNVATASFAQTASNAFNATQLVTSNGITLTSVGVAQGLTLNNSLEIQGGIYDGANAVIAAVFDDQHALYDSSGNAMLDFSSLGFGSMFGNWTVFTGGITSSLYGTAKTGSYVSSSGMVTIQSGNNTTEFRNSSSAQTVNIYGAFTNASSFGRLAIGAVGSDMVIESQPQGSASGSGDLLIKHAGNHSVKFFTNGSQKWAVANNGDWLPTGTTLNIGQPGGNVNNLYVANINGATNVNATSFTGSLFGTASLANNSFTASYVTSSNVVGMVASASFATTASYVATASLLSNGTASIKPTGSFLRMTRNGTTDNAMMWEWSNPATSSQNFWVKAGMALPDVTRWAFTPCDANGFSDYSWAFTFTNNHYTILQGYQNNGSLSIDPSGQTSIYGNGGISLQNDSTINGFLTVNSSAFFDGDLEVSGKITGDGGVDPAYVLYDSNTRGVTKARVLVEVPTVKQTGAAQFFNSDTKRLEIFIASEDTFYDLLGNVIAASGSVDADVTGYQAQMTASRAARNL